MIRKSRGGILPGLCAVVAAFAVAAMASTATAPAARADDPIADITAAVQGDFALGQEAFTLANDAFANGALSDGLALFYGGVDDYLLSVPNSILEGSLAALLGEPVGSALSWTIPTPADLNDAIIVAPTLAAVGLANLYEAGTDLVDGDLIGALDNYLLGVDYLTVVVPELFVVGTVAGFGL